MAVHIKSTTIDCIGPYRLAHFWTKNVKNRVHLDLVPLDRTRDQEVDRVVGLGASVVEDQRRPDGAGWVVLADPEGNEICIERSDAERTALVEYLGRTLAAGMT